MGVVRNAARLRREQCWSLLEPCFPEQMINKIYYIQSLTHALSHAPIPELVYWTGEQKTDAPNQKKNALFVGELSHLNKR